MRWTLVLVLAATAALALAPAATATAAEPRRVRLVYARGAGAASCPTEDALRAQVTARVGYAPFDDAALTTIHVVLTRRGRQLAARITVTEADGATGERVLPSRAADCTELAAATTLALALAIDPLAAAPAPVTADVAPARARAARPGSIEADDETPPAAGARSEVVAHSLAVPLRWHIGFAAFATVGAAPEPTSGGALEVGLRRGRVSLSLQGRWDVPASLTTAGGQVSAGVLLASLIPCWHHGRLALCGVASAGALHSQGHGLDLATVETTPYAAAGARVAWDIPITPALGARLHAEITGTLAQTTLQVAGADVWTTPLVCGAGGLAVIGTF